MRLYRFFIDPTYISKEERRIVIEDKDQVFQISKVLRLSRGGEILLLDGLGTIYTCRIINLTKSLVETEIKYESKEEVKFRSKLSVALPVIKTSRFEWALEKLVELSVDKIIPYTSRYVQGGQIASEKRNQNENKTHRWQRLIKEAAEQSERIRLPLLAPTMSWQELLQEYSAKIDDCSTTTKVKFICLERTDSKFLNDLLNKPDLIQGLDEVLFIVGPEGGFSKDEVSDALNADIQPVSLGPTILRSETAAIAAVSQFMLFRN